MERKDVYLIFRATYRQNTLVYRSVISVEATLDKAHITLANIVRAESIVENVKVRFEDLGTWVLVSNYRKPNFVDLYECKFYAIYKMTVGEMGCEPIYLSDVFVENLKREIYGC